MKRLLTAIITAVILLVFVPKTEAAGDIQGNYFEIEIKTLNKKGIMEGYGNGNFKPNQDVTRAEFAKLIVESLELSIEDLNTESIKQLTDVNLGEWYYPYVQRAVQEGILNGYPDNTFGPNKKISRQEMAAMINRALQKKSIPVTTVQLSFSDLHMINQGVFLADVKNVVSLGIMNGNTDNTFKPRTSTTRGQVAAVLTRMLTVIDETYLQQNAKQRIVVKSTSQTTASVQLQQLEGNQWVNKSGTMNALVGKNGFGKRVEGDGKTPVGTYRLGTAFGWGESLGNLNYPFRKATNTDYWIDDIASPDYNQWISYSGNPKNRWNSYENMNHQLYKYGVVIRYNEDPIVSGKGSAIFLHIKTSTTKYTLGCVALEEKDIINVIKWLREDMNPIITIK